MRDPLIIIGLLTCVVALRLCHTPALRKCGAILLVITTFLGGYFLTDSIAVGIIAAALWLLVPVIDLLARARHLTLPLNNILSTARTPRSDFFPNAREAITTMEQLGFDHVENRAWEWVGSQRYVRIYWHPEELAYAIIYLCEQQNAAFAFVTITSEAHDGQKWRTTNYPFSPGLRRIDGISWNHIPCRHDCFKAILERHRAYLIRCGVTSEQLRMPEPSQIGDGLEEEMRQQLLHNHNKGLLDSRDGEHFTYSRKGLAYLWWQQVKDMVRLC